jgi:putative tricarboxylic transport membrane protein
MLDAWIAGVEGLLQVKELMFLSLGMAIGLLFGALPGLGGATALALLMPLTYGLEPFTAVALAGGVMGAVPMGGSLTAILLNAPGSAPNAATCLDGYPLAQQGKAGYAIGAAATANSLGGIIGTVSVLAVLPVAKELVLLFGPPEFFLLAILALVTVAASLSGRMLRGLLTGGVGLMIATIGYDSVTGTTRFAGGIEYLWDGVHLVPALIGLFAVAEMINLSVTGGTVAKDMRAVKITGVMSGVKATFQHWRTVLRGSIIGTVIGAIPGEGGTVAAFLSYSMTVQASDDPESFGKGNIQGVIAPEAAINAKDGSALIPTIAFGIPSGAEMAVFLGILVLHGMQPGPLMLAQNQNEIYGLVWALTGACILASIIGVLLARPFSLITLVDSRIFVPIIIAVAMTGSYAVDRSIENPILTLAFGILGYIMIRHDYPRLTIVIALVLGATAERNFHQAMMIGDGSWTVFASRPMCWALIAATVLFLALPPLRARLFPPRKSPASPGGGKT